MFALLFVKWNYTLEIRNRSKKRSPMKKYTLPLFLVLLLAACQQGDLAQSSPEAETPQAEIEVFKEENAPTETLNVAFLAINGVYNSELMAPFDIFSIPFSMRPLA